MSRFLDLEAGLDGSASETEPELSMHDSDREFLADDDSVDEHYVPMYRGSTPEPLRVPSPTPSPVLPRTQRMSQEPGASQPYSGPSVPYCSPTQPDCTPVPEPRGDAPAPSARHRCWCGTLNNYTPAELHMAKSVLRCKYYRIGEEIGENGTPHLQAVFYFNSQRNMNNVKAALGCNRWHLEMLHRGSTPQAAAEYCAKGKQSHAEWTRLRTRGPNYGVDATVHDFGDIPQQGKRTDIDAGIELIQSGSSWNELCEQAPKVVLRYPQGTKHLLAARVAVRKEKTVVRWMYGPTGTGKSQYCAENHPDAYWKMGANQWWDGYEGEKTVVLDDFRGDWMTFHHLLRLLDRYPMKVEVKGASINFSPSLILVTSNVAPWEIYSGRTSEDMAQLARRVETVVEMTPVASIEMTGPAHYTAWKAAQPAAPNLLN